MGAEVEDAEHVADVLAGAVDVAVRGALERVRGVAVADGVAREPPQRDGPQETVGAAVEGGSS